MQHHWNTYATPVTHPTFDEFFAGFLASGVPLGIVTASPRYRYAPFGRARDRPVTKFYLFLFLSLKDGNHEYDSAFDQVSLPIHSYHPKHTYDYNAKCLSCRCCPPSLPPRPADQPDEAGAKQGKRRRFRNDGEQKVIAGDGERGIPSCDRSTRTRPQRPGDRLGVDERIRTRAKAV